MMHERRHSESNVVTVFLRRLMLCKLTLYELEKKSMMAVIKFLIQKISLTK